MIRAPRSAHRLYLILPVHNRVAVTMRLMKRLLKQTISNFSVVLVDDGCDDDTVAQVCSILEHRVHTLRGSGNWWWAGSLQQGLDHLARLKVPDNTPVVFMNDDISFDEHFLERGAHYVQQQPDTLFGVHERIAQTGRVMCSGVHLDWSQWRFDFLPPPQAINCLSTRALFLSWSAAQRVGRFRPSLLPHYLSDYEYTHRAQRRGLALRVPEDLQVDVDVATTGVHRIEGTRSLLAFLVTMFSNRTATNPWRYTTFILLACPPRHMPRNLWRVWRGFSRSLVKVTMTRQHRGGVEVRAA